MNLTETRYFHFDHGRRLTEQPNFSIEALHRDEKPELRGQVIIALKKIDFHARDLLIGALHSQDKNLSANSSDLAYGYPNLGGGGDEVTP